MAAEAAAAQPLPADLVLTLGEVDSRPVVQLLARYGLTVNILGDGANLPGSYWGEPEAGLIGDQLYVRSDTPLHSLLHEACHWIVMDPDKRPEVHTDASDSLAEEDATCFLQLLLAAQLPAFGLDRALLDMDRWGYSFRLGSARAWFEQDAEDARDWLLMHGLIDADGEPTCRIRLD
ncbi:MAG: hypothetical protein KDI71_06985 [Xanthomonadales bacterium]|nr:hypothetical protein [Xanthomonadales bacterium]